MTAVDALRASADRARFGLVGSGQEFRPSAQRLSGVREQRRRMSDASIPFNVSFLDDIAFGLLPNDLVVIGAETGAGKTTLGMLLAHQWAAQKLRVKYLALEAHRNEIEMRLLYARMADLAWRRGIEGRHTFTYAAWLHGRCDPVAACVEDDAREELQGELATLETYYREKSFTADDLCRQLHAVQRESDLVVLDHLHYIDADERDDNRAMKHVVKTLGDTVNATETPVVSIAHLRKKDLRVPRLVPAIDDFHGSSDITKVATKVVVMAPARDRRSPRRHIANTYMQVAKDRMVGSQGLIAMLGFDMRTTAYEPRYQLGRLNKKGDEFVPLKADQYPWWAERAVYPNASPDQERLPTEGAP